MINYVIRLVLTGIIVYYVPQFLSKISVDTFTTAVIVAFVMSLLNGIVKPVLKLIALPVTILTLGLFSLVISVIVVYMCHYLVTGFKVEGFLQPLIFSFIISIASSVIDSVLE